MSDGNALTAWQPSENQVSVLRAFQAQDYDCTIEDGCKAAGFTRQSYYDWHDKPDFSKWWAEQADKFFKLQLHRVHSATIKAATSTSKEARGSSADRKLFFERFDKSYVPANRQHQEHSGPNGGAIPMQIVMFGTPIPADADTDDETDPGNPATGA